MAYTESSAPHTLFSVEAMVPASRAGVSDEAILT